MAIFDTLAYSKKLIAAGVPVVQAEVQAEVHAEAIAEIIDEQLASKRDLAELEMRLIIKLGAMIAASIAITVTLIKVM